MKIITTILLVLTALLSHAWCKSSKSYESRICGSIAFEIQVDFIDQGKEPPSSWDELTSVISIKEGWMEPDILIMEIVNRFALVPEKSLIHNDSAVPMKYNGKRLLAISRWPQVDGVKKFSGRYVIFWGPRRSNPDDLFLEVDFIPEKVALGILAQIPEFDAASQPLAFDKAVVDQVKRSNKVSQDELRQSVGYGEARMERDKIKKNSPDRETNDPFGSKWALPGIFVLVALIVVGLFFGRRYRRIHRKMRK